jgi:hypothetical protein
MVPGCVKRRLEGGRWRGFDETWRRFLFSPRRKGDDREEGGAVETGRPTAAAVVGAPGYALRADLGNPESSDYLINLFE